MEISPDGVETEMIDLTDMPLAELPAYDERVLARSIKQVLAQIERSRVNIGTGDPGRVD